MLTRDRITREELYEAVWKEPVQKVAAALGLSDVGLAKIAKKLHVPLPGRGYWARGPMARKRLKAALPWVRPDFKTTFCSVQATAADQLSKEQETRRQLQEAGIVIPVVDESVDGTSLDSVLESSRPLLNAHGLDSVKIREEEACADITVSPELVDRALRIFQLLCGAFRRSGLELEIIPPCHRDNGSKLSSQTGVLVLDCFVVFS